MSTDWDLQRISRTALIIAVVLISIWMLSRFLPALAWAAVLAIATWPLRTYLDREHMGKTRIAAVLTLILAVVLVLPLILIGLEAAHEGGTVTKWVHDVRHDGLGTPDWLSHLPYIGSAVAAWWTKNLAPPGAAGALMGRADASGVISITRSLGIQVANRLTILVFSLLTLFFLYRDGPAIMEQSHAISDRLFGPTGGQLGRNAVTAVRGTVNGLVLVGLGEGVLLAFGYWETGLPHAALLGLATGVLAMIPFGAPLIYIVCALVLFAQAKTAGAIGLLVYGSLIVFVADHFIRPVLIGNSTRLPFLLVLLGIFGGLETFGLIGLFLGPALMSVLIAVWREAAEQG